MAKLSASQRKSLPKSDFAVKSKANTSQGKAKSGSYPINDRNHAQNALARSAGKPEEAQVKAAVRAKYPDMVGKSSSTVRSKMPVKDRINAALQNQKKSK